MAPARKRFVVYARKSPGESRGASIPAQVDWGERRGQDRGLVLAEDLGVWLRDGQEFALASGAYIDEGSHGSVLRSREALWRMLLDAKAHRFDTLVVYRSDRLSRSEGLGYYIVKALQQFGVEILAGDNPDGSDLIWKFTSVIADHEVHVIRQRTKDALDDVRKSKYLGRRPLGFVDLDHAWVPRPETETISAMVTNGMATDAILATEDARELGVSTSWSLGTLMRNMRAFKTGRLEALLEARRKSQTERLERMHHRDEREERELTHRLIDLVPNLQK